MLLDGKADPNAKDIDGETPLHAAAHGAGERGAVASLVLAFGATVDARNLRGRTPLHCAAVRDDGAVVLALVRAGADVRARDKGGLTPAAAAAGSSSTMAQYLRALEGLRKR